MSFVKMYDETKISTPVRRSTWGYQENVNSGQTGDWVEWPANMQGLSMRLITEVDSTLGRFEDTMSVNSEVSNGSPFANSWTPGNVSISTDAVLRTPVTAVRGVCVAGSMSIELRGIGG